MKEAPLSSEDLQMFSERKAVFCLDLSQLVTFDILNQDCLITLTSLSALFRAVETFNLGCLFPVRILYPSLETEVFRHIVDVAFENFEESMPDFFRNIPAHGRHQLFAQIMFWYNGFVSEKITGQLIERSTTVGELKALCVVKPRSC